MKPRRRAAIRGAALAAPRWWPTWTGLALLRASALLPLPWTRALGRGLGRALARLIPSRRHVTRVNVDLCFPELDEAAREALVHDHFAALGASLFEMAYGWWGSARALERMSRIVGREHLDAALAEGRGVILLQGHFVTTDIGGQMLGLRLPFTATYAPPKNAVMRSLTERLRGRFVARQIHHEEVRRILRALAANEVVWHGPDQSARRGGGVRATFFGRPAQTNTATAKLARISGAPVVPYHPVRMPDGRYELRIEPALPDFPDNDLQAATQRVNDTIERHARAAPEQYLWSHRRFKRTGGEGPNPYE